MDLNAFKTIENVYENNTSILKLLYGQIELLETLNNKYLPSNIKNDLDNILVSLKHIQKKYCCSHEILQKIVKSDNADIGILYGNNHKKHIYKITKVLQEFSVNNDVSIICFTADDIDIDRLLVKGDVISGQIIRTSISNIPSKIFNMQTHTLKENIKKIRKLRVLEDITIINPVNRFNHSIVCEILKSVSRYEKLILPSINVSEQNLFEYLDKYKSVFLMPERGIGQRKAVVIEEGEVGKSNIIFGSEMFDCENHELYNMVRKMTHDKNFLILKGVNLIKYQNNPVEIRVYVQKNSEARWVVTGNTIKVDIFSYGKTNNNITYNCREVLANLEIGDIDAIEKNLNNTAINICCYLDYYFSNLGACTIDFILDENKKIYIINFAGVEQNFKFMMYEDEIFFNYFKNALEFLMYQLNQNKEVNKDVD